MNGSEPPSSNTTFVRFRPAISATAAPARAEPVTETPGPAAALSYKEAREQLLNGFERTYIRAMLDEHQGNVTHAAKAAGIARKHFHELMNKHALSAE